MTMRPCTWIGMALLTWLVAPGAVSADDRAARLYHQGLADVTATLPSSGLTIASETMPCVNCHGADGQGGREGGVAVPPIPWRRLATPAAERPAYDLALLARALREGIGAGGAPLHDLMPRYAVSDELVGQLAIWLELLRRDGTPGVTDDQIVIAIPPAKADDMRSAVVSATLKHYAETVNMYGGLYGRTIRLVDDKPESADIFGRLAALTPPGKSGNGVLDLWPLHTGSGQASAFALMPSDERLLGALLKAAQRKDPDARQLSSLPANQNDLPRTLVFGGGADALSALVEARSGSAILTIYTTPDHIDLKKLQQVSSRPVRILLANPLAAGGTSDDPKATDRLRGFERAADQLRLPAIAKPIARAAWVAASLLEQALRTTGRHLDQGRFEAAVRAMSALESGLLSPVHPTRGLTSVGLVEFDLVDAKIERSQLTLP